LGLKSRANAKEGTVAKENGGDNEMNIKEDAD